MHPATTITLISLATTAAAAESSSWLTTSYFGGIYGAFGTPYASVIAASPSPGPATFLLQCGADFAADDPSCDWHSPGYTVTVGPSTFAYTLNMNDITTRTTLATPTSFWIESVVATCEILASTSAVCARPNDVLDANYLTKDLGTSTQARDTYTGDLGSLWSQMVVTAGLEKLSAASASASATGAAETTRETASGSEAQSTVASRTAASSGSSSTSTATSASAAAESTGGAGRFGVPFGGAIAGFVAGALAL